jgi:undecaprenyl-diphosphatase
MEFLLLIKAIILGMVEGLTEFAPVSSTGHMIIVDDMWLKSEEFLTSPIANMFKVVIQLGSILAVVVVFWRRFLDMFGIKRDKSIHAPKGGHLKLTQVIVGLIPAGVLGVLFGDYIDKHLFTTKTVMVGLAIGAVLMIIADIYNKKNKQPTAETVDQITYKQAFIIGLIQCLSLWPGFSRSGATISGGVLMGLSYRAAADFTFIMAVPIMAGASGISLLKNLNDFTADAMPFFIVGFISAFVFAMLSIRFFLKIIEKIHLTPFAIYRLVLVVVLLFVIL